MHRNHSIINARIPRRNSDRAEMILSLVAIKQRFLFSAQTAFFPANQTDHV
mgnify:FL=1